MKLGSPHDILTHGLENAEDRFWVRVSMLEQYTGAQTWCEVQLELTQAEPVTDDGISWKGSRSKKDMYLNVRNFRVGLLHRLSLQSTDFQKAIAALG